MFQFVIDDSAQQKKQTLSNWHDDDEDEYDDEDDVVFGEDPTNKTKSHANASATSKTTQNSSS